MSPLVGLQDPDGGAHPSRGWLSLRPQVPSCPTAPASLSLGTPVSSHRARAQEPQAQNHLLPSDGGFLRIQSYGITAVWVCPDGRAPPTHDALVPRGGGKMACTCVTGLGWPQPTVQSLFLCMWALFLGADSSAHQKPGVGAAGPRLGVSLLQSQLGAHPQWARVDQPRQPWVFSPANSFRGGE